MSVKKVHTNRRLLEFTFGETETKLSLQACPECCDDTWFEFYNGLPGVLVGCVLGEIHEEEIEDDKEIPIPQSSYGNSICAFRITIPYTDADGKQQQYRFWRISESNGYYSGYLFIKREP